MEATKLLLSAEELNLVCDTHWLLTKNNIIEKAKGLFGGLAALVQEEIESKRERLPESIHLFSPKVFKGEYYQGLPYVMLDYPRIFSKENVFAMRTMFWWGNFFSITLQLKGYYQDMYAQKLLSKKELLASKGFYVAISGDEWRHDFEKDNYELISADDNLDKAVEGEFLKIAVKIPLLYWNQALELIREQQQVMIGLLAD
jgi:hypothetical protein